MIKLVRNDGLEFNFGNLFKVRTLKGVGDIGVNIFSEKKAIGHGDIVTGQRIPPRIIEIKAININPALKAESRKIANTFFNVNYDFKIYITYKGNSVWIPCKIENFNLPTNNIYDYQELILELYASDPLFRSVDEFGKDIASIKPKFGFPLISIKNKGFIYGVYNFDKNVFISNDGMENTYIRAIVKADGLVEDFILKKNEDEFILFKGELNKGDELIIDTKKAAVLLNGENAIVRTDRKSTFFDIDIGGNYISYDAKIGDNVVKVNIFYNKLYTGV